MRRCGGRAAFGSPHVDEGSHNNAGMAAVLTARVCFGG